jgi:hypothetical protein
MPQVEERLAALLPVWLADHRARRHALVRLHPGQVRDDQAEDPHSQLPQADHGSSARLGQDTGLAGAGGALITDTRRAVGQRPQAADTSVQAAEDRSPTSLRRGWGQWHRQLRPDRSSGARAAGASTIIAVDRYPRNGRRRRRARLNFTSFAIID